MAEYDSSNADENVRADNLETVYRLAFSKPYMGGVLMWSETALITVTEKTGLQPVNIGPTR